MTKKRQDENVCAKDALPWGIIVLSGVGAIIVLYVLAVAGGVLPGEGGAIKAWAALQYNERGDFLAGFLSALAVSGAVAAVILQSKALQEQRREMRNQSKIFKEQLDAIEIEQRHFERQLELQTEAFERDMLDREIEAFRQAIPHMERQLIAHAKMIRQYADPKYERTKDADMSESTIFFTIAALGSCSLADMKDGSARHLLDRICSYAKRFDDLHKKAVLLDERSENDAEVLKELRYYCTYSSFGQLLRKAKWLRKRMASEGIVKGNNYAYDKQQNIWVSANARTETEHDDDDDDDA